MYMQLNFLWKSDCLGCVVLLCFVVCMTLLASFFLPSASPINSMYMYSSSHWFSKLRLDGGWSLTFLVPKYLKSFLHIVTGVIFLCQEVERYLPHVTTESKETEILPYTGFGDEVLRSL